MHQMGRLYHQVLYAIVYGTLQGLIHIVDLLVITGLYMVDDDLCGKGSSYGPVRICGLQGFLDTSDICCTAVIERSTETYYQQFVVTDVISV